MIREKTTYYLACDGDECRAMSADLIGSGHVAIEHGARCGWFVYRFIHQPSRRHKPRIQHLDYCPECAKKMDLAQREMKADVSRTGRRVERHNGKRWILIQEQQGKEDPHVPQRGQAARKQALATVMGARHE